MRDVLLTIPNFPADDAPDGDTEDFAIEVKKVGDPPSFDFEPKDHVDLGEAMHIFDSGRAAKLSGSRFSVARGAGAVLERALATFFLTLHTSRHGYEEISVPNLVNRTTMTGTGQLPKFEEDLFRTGVGDRELFLIPTAEVPLTNLHAGEILPAEELPYAYTAWTPVTARRQVPTAGTRAAFCGCTSSPRSSWCGYADPTTRVPSWRPCWAMPNSV